LHILMCSSSKQRCLLFTAQTI